MDVAALGLIATGGILGLFMLRYGLAGKHMPKGLALIHGFFVLGGFATLLTYNLTTPNSHKHWPSVGIFTCAILLGFYLFFRDVTKKGAPPWLLLLHGAIGATGIGWLFMHTLGGK